MFRLSAEALRTAGGQVRCGRCGEVFNALTRLAEAATDFTKGESSLFLESRAEEILEAPPPAELGEPEGTEASVAADFIDGGAANDEIDESEDVEIAQLQFLEPDEELAAESSLEFTLPPGDLDRIFVETRPNLLQHLATDVPRGERESSTVEDEDSPVLTAAPVAASPVPIASPAPIAPPAPIPTPAPVHAPAPPPVSTAKPAPRARPGLEIAESIRLEMLSGLSTAASSKVVPAHAKPRNRWALAAWVLAAVVLTLALAFQIVRDNGAWVAQRVPLLREAAPLLGASVLKPVDLSMYQLQQWGVSGDPGAKGTLRVRASIMNTAAELQPYPLLRVSLVNRFGTRVGSREFEPAEYLGHAVGRMLGPGERAEATLDILDPGKDAEGFEIDVCLRSADKKITCAGDAASQSK